MKEQLWRVAPELHELLKVCHTQDAPTVTALVSVGTTGTNYIRACRSRIRMSPHLEYWVPAVPTKNQGTEGAQEPMPFTSEGRLSPEAVPHLHIVIPAQAAAVQVHRCEVQNNLGGEMRGEERRLHGSQSSCPWGQAHAHCLAGGKVNHHQPWPALSLTRLTKNTRPLFPLPNTHKGSGLPLPCTPHPSRGLLCWLK